MEIISEQINQWWVITTPRLNCCPNLSSLIIYKSLFQSCFCSLHSPSSSTSTLMALLVVSKIFECKEIFLSLIWVTFKFNHGSSLLSALPFPLSPFSPSLIQISHNPRSPFLSRGRVDKSPFSDCCRISSPAKTISCQLVAHKSLVLQRFGSNT